LPLVVLVVALFGQILAVTIGELVRERARPLRNDERDSFNIVQAASLTLLGLIIGFSFSMAVSRYDQRKNLEAQEANAIGTELTRADLLPTSDAAKTRELLAKYLNQRIFFYSTKDRQQLAEIATETARLQADLSSVVQRASTAQPTPITALAVAGMNDVLNSQGYTEAAWRNRVPFAAWGRWA
jgi:hypothetical protein